MPKVDVHLWIGDEEDVVTYTVDVDGGVDNTDVAADRAMERAEADGHDNVNLKQVEPA